MNKIGVFEIIFILGSLACIQYSTYGWVKITATLLLMVYLIMAKIRMRNNRIKALRTIEQQITIDEIYKEKNNSNYIYCIAFIILAVINVKNMIINMEMLHHGSLQSNSLFEVLTHLSSNDVVTLLSYAFFIVLGVALLIEGLNSVTVMTNDKIVFYNGTSYDIDEITKFSYKTTRLFKREIIVVHIDQLEYQLYL